jgi:hypothetical protein
VFAFERLESELARLSAPNALLESARRSRDDEVRHARISATLARRFGATASEPNVEPVRERSPFAVALENAIEGCINETYAALVAHWQAETASDAAIACTMRGIAADETRHATLAWKVAAWLEPQLTDSERRAVARARHDALTRLRATLEREPHDDLVAIAGLPRAAQALALLDGLGRELLSSAPAPAAS